MNTIRFGRVQMRIMQVLWENERATSQEISSELNEYEPIVFKNVQTLLRELEKKGAIAHEVVNGAYYYYTLVTDEKVKKKLVRDFIDRLFGGSTAGLLSSIIKDRSIPPEEMKKISEMLKTKEK
jgi:BlaI family transcriptional regulator, penicillinase repressor